jgi:hypothetical protein
MCPRGHAAPLGAPRPEPREGPPSDAALYSDGRTRSRSLQSPLHHPTLGSEWRWKRTRPRKGPCRASAAHASTIPSVTAVTRLTVWRGGRLTIQASAQHPKSSLNAAAAGVTTPPTTGVAGRGRRLRRLLQGGHLRGL